MVHTLVERAKDVSLIRGYLLKRNGEFARG